MDNLSTLFFYSFLFNFDYSSTYDFRSLAFAHKNSIIFFLLNCWLKFLLTTVVPEYFFTVYSCVKYPTTHHSRRGQRGASRPTLDIFNFCDIIFFERKSWKRKYWKKIFFFLYYWKSIFFSKNKNILKKDFLLKLFFFSL